MHGAVTMSPAVIAAGIASAITSVLDPEGGELLLRLAGMIPVAGRFAMHSTRAFQALRWPLAVALGLATMAIAILAAALGYRGLMAIPPWARPLFSGVMLTAAGASGIVGALIRRRRRGDSARRRTRLARP